MNTYYEKYLKYKNKYLKLKNLYYGGAAAGGHDNVGVFGANTESMYISLDINPESSIGEEMLKRCKVSLKPIEKKMHKGHLEIAEQGGHFQPHITLLEFFFDKSTKCGQKLLKSKDTDSIVKTNLEKSGLLYSTIKSESKDYDFFGRFFVRKYTDYSKEAYDSFKVGLFTDFSKLYKHKTHFVKGHNDGTMQFLHYKKDDKTKMFSYAIKQDLFHNQWTPHVSLFELDKSYHPKKDELESIISEFRKAAGPNPIYIDKLRLWKGKQKGKEGCLSKVIIKIKDGKDKQFFHFKL